MVVPACQTNKPADGGCGRLKHNSLEPCIQKSGPHRSTQQPSGVFPTWPANFPLLAIPLDPCLVGSEICVARKRIGPNLGSDHKPLIVDLVWQNEEAVPRQAIFENNGEFHKENELKGGAVSF